jgi:formate dehydrogenase major subunit
VVTREGNVLRIQGDWDAPVNGGALCVLGRFEPLYEKRPRILAPVVRDKGRQEKTGWDRALRAAADRIGGTRPERLGVLASTHATNEALYLVSKLFGRELKAAQMGLLNACAPPLAAETKGSLKDVARSDCILVVGADPAKEQPVASFFVKRAVDNGAELILVGDRGTALAPFASLCVEASNIGQAVERAQRAQAPAVLYGAGLADAVANALAKLNGKATFVGLDPGVNTRAARTYGLENNLDPAGIEVLYVLAGEQEWDGREMLGRLRKDAFLIVQASYASPLTERADVVLPMAIWSERSGTLTNTEGRVQEVRKAADPAGEARPDWEILSMLGEKLGKRVGGSLGEIAERATQQLH